MPAKSLCSYMDALYTILDEFKPRRCFEWGPGTSTQILCLYPSVEYVKSIEHSDFFYDMIEKLNLQPLSLEIQSDMDDYVGAIGDGTYDLIFIDGRDRVRCLEMAKGRSPIIMIHDAARQQYREAIKKYDYVVWTDDGNTAILTDNEATFHRIAECIGKSACPEPKEEIIYVKDGVAP